MNWFLKKGDVHKALSLVESLLPLTSSYKKICRYFQLQLTKSEILIKTRRYPEAIELLQNLFHRSESQGNKFSAKVLYLISLARIGFVKLLKDKTADSNITIINGLPVRNFEALDVRPDVLLAAKLFLKELHLKEGLQCLHLLGKIDGQNKVNRNRSVVLQVLKIQEFAAQRIELLFHSGEYERESFKITFRIFGMMRSLSKMLV